MKEIMRKTCSGWERYYLSEGALIAPEDYRPKETFFEFLMREIAAKYPLGYRPESQKTIVTER